jgi:hypothetical protein
MIPSGNIISLFVNFCQPLFKKPPVFLRLLKGREKGESLFLMERTGTKGESKNDTLSIKNAIPNHW